MLSWIILKVFGLTDYQKVKLKYKYDNPDEFVSKVQKLNFSFGECIDTKWYVMRCLAFPALDEKTQLIVTCPVPGGLGTANHCELRIVHSAKTSNDVKGQIMDGATKGWMSYLNLFTKNGKQCVKNLKEVKKLIEEADI